MRLAPGSKVGPYEVVASLGAGGMSEVYRVRDPRLQREVALKVVGERLSGDTSFLARLEQEARLAGSLNHPNIVAVHDVGSHDGSPYVVTELLQGETLRDRMRGRVSTSQAIDWTIQIAEGLAAAHQRGIVHRDLKPENVFLTRSGHVKILDFGIAKAAAVVTEPRGLLEPTLSPQGYETQTGAVLGTPGYMSPEQLRGEPVDARSDLFATGAILYELLSGHRAFPGSMVESGHAILHDDPAPLPERVPQPIARVVQRCLAKDPDQRFQSARDLGFALDAIRGATVSTQALAGGAPARRRWLGPGLALLTAAAVAAALLATLQRRPPSSPRVQMLTFRRGSVLGARFAPDGKTVHYSAAWNGTPPQVFSTSVESPESHPLGVGDAHLLAVAPSGELALSLRPRMVLFDGPRGTLARVSPLGGAPRELATNAEYADWTPDGTQLAVVRTLAGRSRLEFPLGHVLFEAQGWVSHPRISPDGKRVAFVHHTQPADSAGLAMVADASGATEVWSPEFDELLGLAWEPDGRSLLITGAHRSTLDFLWRARRGRDPELVYASTGNLLLADLAPDGRALVIQTDWRQEIEVLTRDGGQRSVEWLDWGLLGAISPDGSKVLMAENGKGAIGRWMLLLRDVTQPAPVKLGEGPPIGLSPDGRWAVTLDRAQPPNLVLLPTGPGEPRPLPPSGLARIDRGAFFPDGRRLVLVGAKAPGGAPEAFIYDSSTGGARQITSEGVLDSVAIAPDGRQVATSNTEGAVLLYSVDGAEPLRVDAWASDFRVAGWLEDGSLLAFQPYALPSRLERYDPRSKKTSLVRTLAPLDPAGVAAIIRVRVTPDGKALAFQLRRMSAALTVLDWGGRPP